MTKLIAIDFDGVIHSYTSGWQGSGQVSDPMVSGALEFLQSILSSKEFNAVIYSTRAETQAGREAIKKYLLQNGMLPSEVDKIAITYAKPKATIYIDDRGFRFEGAFPSLEEIRTLKPWNR